MKTKIKSHNDEVTDFYDKKFPKVDSNYTCLTVINLDSPLKKDENYYPQVSLKECKYINKKVIFLLLTSLMILMKNRFYFNEHVSNFCYVNFSLV